MGAKKSISNSFTVNTVEDGATLTVKSAMHSVGIRCTSDGKSDGSGSSAGMVTLYVDGTAVPTTYLSIKSRPSGLTVLTHTQQSAIPEGGVSISWANNVDRANLEGEVVLTVSYNSYSTEFSIPIICAKDGEDGTSVKQVFKRALSQPTTPTGLNPTGWSENPPAQNTGDSEYLTSGDYAGWNKLETIDDDFSKDVITFVTTYPNEKVVIRILASSEENYDFIYVSDLDSHIEETCEYDDVPDARKASGDGVEKYVETIVPTSGVHTLDVAYNKDSTDSYYLDCGFYQVITAGDRIWASVATIKGSTVIGSWSTPVIWNGKEGRDGQDGERGKTGRFYYYADVWNASDTTQEFSATDAEAPFFKVGNQYYVYIGDTNFTNQTMSWMNTTFGAPSSSNANYEIMVTDFKYLITEAIFGKYAHFGSAIINGDWMISQHGTYGGSTPLTYRQFDPTYPNVSVNTTHTVNGVTWQGYNFVPNYAVDLLKGTTYMQNAEVTGTIHAQNLYHNFCLFSEGGTYSNFRYYCVATYTDDKTYYEGEYYTAEDVAGTSDLSIHFKMCTYDCDVINLVPAANSNWVSSPPASRTFELPDPKDYQGKIIEIYSFRYSLSTNGAAFVSCVVSDSFATLLKNEGGEIKREDTGQRHQLTLNIETPYKFMSVRCYNATSGGSYKWYWLKLMGDLPPQ